MGDIDVEQRKPLSRITSRLLNLRAGTPLTDLRKSLASRRTLLDEIMTENLLRIVGGQYLPTFRGIDHLEDDIRRVVRENLTYVFGALQHLYRGSSTQYVFSFDAVVQATRSIGPTRDAYDVLPALLLGEEFNYYYIQNGTVSINKS